MTELLAGRVAAITGGCSGIGLASAEAFLEHGARVVIADIRDEQGEAIAERLGPDARYVHCDVTSDEQIGQLVDAATAQFGRLDIMFNNASGLGDASPLLDLGPEGVDRAMRVTTGSVVSGHRHAARAFLAQGTTGSIISTSSGCGLSGGLGPAGYTIGKHAVIGVVRAAAGELSPQGIRTNAICPGITLTPTWATGVPREQKAEFLQRMADELAAEQPLGRVAQPSEIAGAAVFLASDLSSFVTGAVIPVDGGADAVSQSRLTAITNTLRAEFAAR